MKKHLTLILLGIIASANVSFAQSSIILHDKQINKFAAVIWESFSADSCVVTDVVVQTGETKQTFNGGGKPFSSGFTYLGISVVDYCSFEYLYYAEDVVWTGGAVADNLTSASGGATMSLTDQVGGGTVDAEFSLNWISNSGMVTGEFSNAHLNLKGIHIGANNNGNYRLADISGSLVVNGVDIFNNQPSLSYIIRGGPSNIINIHPRLAQQGSGTMTDLNSSVSLYPVPASDVLHVEVSNASHYSIVNLLGAEVAAKNLDGMPMESIDLSTVVPGIYFLHLQTDQGAVVKRFVKE